MSDDRNSHEATAEEKNIINALFFCRSAFRHAMSTDVDVWLACLGDAIESFDEESAETGSRYKAPVCVPRIEYASISSEEFLEKYSIPNKPIILGNADEHLPMHLTVDYWMKNHADKVVPLDVNTPSQVYNHVVMMEWSNH